MERVATLQGAPSCRRDWTWTQVKNNMPDLVSTDRYQFFLQYNMAGNYTTSLKEIIKPKHPVSIWLASKCEGVGFLFHCQKDADIYGN